MSRILSIDFGLKRIGLAISDESCLIATGLETILAEKTVEGTIKKLSEKLKSYSLKQIIIGNPLHMDGKESILSKYVQEFALLLKEQFACEVILWDERLSSKEAERTLKEGSMNRKKRSGLIDSIAAILLLQSYLSFLELQS